MMTSPHTLEQIDMSNDQQKTFRPLNNWIMAEALRDGLTCRIPSKHIADVLKALDYHKIKAVIEQEDKHHILVTPKP